MNKGKEKITQLAAAMMVLDYGRYKHFTNINQYRSLIDLLIQTEWDHLSQKDIVVGMETLLDN